MAGTITRLAFQQHTADRVNVYLDGRFTFALPALEAVRLQVGQFLADDAIERLQALDAGQKAYDRAIRFLGYRPRSRAEVRRRLSAAGIDPELVDATLARLAEQGYLDDTEFARYWVENRQQFRPKGAQALRQELRQRGVEGAAIESALAGIDPAESAYEAARGWARRLNALAQADPVAYRRKLSDFLLRRGFGYEIAREVVTRLVRELQDGTAASDE
jgi:regulatory protein